MFLSDGQISFHTWISTKSHTKNYTFFFLPVPNKRIHCHKKYILKPNKSGSTDKRFRLRCLFRLFRLRSVFFMISCMVNLIRDKYNTKTSSTFITVKTKSHYCDKKRDLLIGYYVILPAFRRVTVSDFWMIHR